MTKRLGLVFSILLVALLAVPTIAWLGVERRDTLLYGYIDKLPDRPQDPVASFFDKRLQAWTERYIDVNFGFRVELIRSFNEAVFGIFREMPRLRLYATPEAGLYSGMSLEYLNKEIVQKDALDRRYVQTAARLLRVQSLLEAQGKVFVVVIAASKPYVYTGELGKRYLAGGEDRVFERKADFGQALKDAGVNVIDSAPMLRNFRRETGMSTHPTSGVHWNFYAGCLIAGEIMSRARMRFPALQPFDCGIPRYDEPQLADVDGLSLLNIWSDAGLRQDTPRPSVVERTPDQWRPSMVVVGDSFADEILSPLHQGRAYSKVVNSGYFKVRAVGELDGAIRPTHDVNGNYALARAQVLDDIRASDIVILQVVDYNLEGNGFGFPEYVLKHLAQADRFATTDAASVQKPVVPAANLLKALVFADVDNRINPIQVPAQTRLVESPEKLLKVASEGRWDVIAVMQNASHRSQALARELKDRGYEIIASNSAGVLALPKEQTVSAFANLQFEWEGYGMPSSAPSRVTGSWPVVESTRPVDMGFYTQELKLDRPVLVRASFEGTIVGKAPRAAHLSLYGVKPIFDLQQGIYTPDEDFYAIVPAQSADSPVRLSFGLGGWTKGQGKLRLNSLSIYPVLSNKDALAVAFASKAEGALAP